MFRVVMWYALGVGGPGVGRVAWAVGVGAVWSLFRTFVAAGFLARVLVGGVLVRWMGPMLSMFGPISCLFVF